MWRDFQVTAAFFSLDITIVGLLVYDMFDKRNGKMGYTYFIRRLVLLN